MFNKCKSSERWWRERSHGFGVPPAGAHCSHDFDTVQALHLVEYNVYLGKRKGNAQWGRSYITHFSDSSFITDLVTEQMVQLSLEMEVI